MTTLVQFWFEKVIINRISILLIIICFGGNYSLAQHLENELNDYINSYRINKNIPSIAGGLSVNGKTIWLSAVGFADLEHNVPVSINSIYRIASISKSITAVAIMQLVEQGKIHLDDDALKHLPYFPKKKWIFTIRQILNHTAGIRDYRFGEFNSTNSYKSIKDCIRVVMDDSLLFEPGSKRLYSTLAYNLLAGIIENVSGLSFEEYLTKNIFQPAEMNSTFLEYQPKIIQRKVRGYIKNRFRILENAQLADLSIKFAGGGIISTAQDLLKFSESILSYKLISKASLDQMIYPTILKNKDTVNYGLGFSLGVDYKGRKYFGHAGGGTGFTSELIMYPDQMISAVFLTNIRDRNLDNPAKSFITIFLDKNYEYPKKSLADRLLNIFFDASYDSMLTKFEQLKKDSSFIYKIDDDETKLLGYDLIETGNYIDAIYFFKYLISQKPNHTNFYIGLADAYYKDGNKGMALRNFRTAVSLEPQNKYALEMIKKIEKQ